MTLEHLDRQLSAIRHLEDVPDLTDRVWSCLATSIHDEIASLGEAATSQLRLSALVPPERHAEEVVAFQNWMDIAEANSDNAAIVRAQLTTQLYVAFVWLWDSLMTPAAELVSTRTAFATVQRFLTTGRRGVLRGAVASGRWCCRPDLAGIECWTEPRQGQQRVDIGLAELGAWQMLGRASAISALLALTRGPG